MKDNFIQTSFMILVLLASMIGLAQPYFEAKSFNRLTGGDATYMDAMFTELRVTGPASGEK